MKKLTFALILALLLFTTAQLKAQSALWLDSVEFRMNDHLSMEIIANNFHDLSQWGSIDSLFSLFLEDMDRLDVKALSDDKSNSLTYMFESPYRKIRINKETSVENEVSIDSKGNVIHFQTAEFHINNRERLIFKSPSLKGFNQIGKMKLDELIKSADPLISPKGKKKMKHKSAHLYIANDELQEDTNAVCLNGCDVIELGAGIGMGTVRTTLTPDLEVGLMVSLSRKGIFRNNFGASYQSMFFFQEDEEGNQEIKNDGFVNLIYASTGLLFSGSGKLTTTGVKVGVMVDHNSKAFANDAYKIGIFQSRGLISLEGGVFAENNFKDWYPFMRLSFGF